MSEEKEKSDVALREEKILEFWNTNEIFKKTLEKDSPKGNFVFYEGPPTANAKPALHHLEARVFKDIIPRFKTMSGYNVRRKGGWDTHGLPVELQIEKKLGLKSKKEIEQYGVEKFNKECKDSVFEYIGDWEKFTDRIGYWVDKKNAYYTFDTDYIESVWNILKEVNEKKLLYKDYKVLPWCPRCGTALSSHELAQGYQDDTDLSVTAKFKVTNPEKIGLNGNVYLLAWTTTPWTLPGNVALAVGLDIEYSIAKIKIQRDGFSRIEDDSEQNGLTTSYEYQIFAKNQEHFLWPEKDRKKILQSGNYYFENTEKVLKGKDLIGLKYEPLYDYLDRSILTFKLPGRDNSFKVHEAGFVNTDEGTGIVHTAVMYGQDDFVLGSKIGLPKYHLVLEDGHFKTIQLYPDGTKSNMDFLSERYVKEVDEKGKPTLAVDIIDDLRQRDLFFGQKNIKHSYPHCWRCKTPLIYYARDSWYISMSKLREKLVAENENINWEPTHIKEGRFGEWLREIKDWAISRERYWGTPLPIWSDVDGNYRVVGSVDEIRKMSRKSNNNYFVMRHGETEGNVRGVWSVDSEKPHSLTEKGKDQVVRVTKSLKDKSIDIVIASPFGRTQETANLIVENLGLPKSAIVIDPRIGEWNVGKEFDGKPLDDFFNVRNNSEDRYTFKTDDGESYNEVLKRSGQFIYDLEQKYKGKNILVVSHGAVTRAISIVARGFTYRNLFNETRDFRNFDNAEIREVEFYNLPRNSEYEVDLHKPFIDSVELIDEKGVVLKRVKEVMDVWFDSGAMPFAQDHYPWNKGELLYPADFISEAIDQTRGWFYTLHAIGVLLDKGNAYKNVICLGHILDSEGKKMSKSIGNIVDPWVMMNRYGVDALRLWMYTVNSPGDSKNFDEKTVDEIVKKVFNPVVNIVAFFDLYKDSSIKPTSQSKNILDKWILSKLNELVSSGTESLNTFKVFESARLIKDFVNDFSTWYIRRSRDRFKSEDKKERDESLSTTLFVLCELMKYMAPFTPFFAEEVYQKIKLSSDRESVHLSDWPEALSVDADLLSDMEKARSVVTKALELRQKAGHKVRQPLSTLTVGENFSKEFLDIVADEVNVKEVKVLEGSEVKLDTNLTTDLKNEGVARDVIRGIQDARKSENLNPSQKINLIVNTDEKTKSIIELFSEMIKFPTQVGDITYNNEEQTHKMVLENSKMSISIVK